MHDSAIIRCQILVRLANDTVHTFDFDMMSELLDNGEKFLEVYNVPSFSRKAKALLLLI